MADEFTRLGPLGEVPEGELRAYEMPAGRACVAHAAGEVYAIGDECTHSGCSLAEDGELTDDESVECTCHGSVFDLHSGEPLKGPASDPVPVFPARIVDGWIEVAPAPEE